MWYKPQGQIRTFKTGLIFSSSSLRIINISLIMKLINLSNDWINLRNIPFIHILVSNSRENAIDLIELCYQEYPNRPHLNPMTFLISHEEKPHLKSPVHTHSTCWWTESQAQWNMKNLITYVIEISKWKHYWIRNIWIYLF